MSDSATPWTIYSPWNSIDQSTGVGSLSLLQGIFPTQWSNPGVPHCRWILYQFSHKRSPRVLEWVAYPFSSRSSWPRNRTGISCIAGKILYQLSHQGSPLPGGLTLRCLFSPLSMSVQMRIVCGDQFILTAPPAWLSLQRNVRGWSGRVITRMSFVIFLLPLPAPTSFWIRTEKRCYLGSPCIPSLGAKFYRLGTL